MNNLKREADNIRMTPEEKQAMRMALFDAPKATPVSASPYFSFLSISALLNVRSVVAALLVFALVGSSTAYAAEDSLPGDFLYTVKVSVNEPIALALATTPEAKVKTEVRLADRRLAEAKTLAAEGRLDVAVSLEIERDFDKHIENALALADVEPEVEAADAASGTFEAASNTRSAKTMAVSVDTSMMMQMATGTEIATSTDDEDDTLVRSLEEKKRIFRELKERTRLRAEGEVRGADTEDTDHDEKRDQEDDEDEPKSREGLLQKQED